MNGQQKYVLIMLNKNSPENVKHLVNDVDPLIRQILAETTTSPEILDNMSHDPLPSIRSVVVKNEHTPNETLLKLALSETDFFVLNSILSNNFPENIYIAARASLFIRFHRATKPIKNELLKSTAASKRSKYESKNVKKVSNRCCS